MSGLDGYTSGLALGKMLTDKEFEREAEALRLRLKLAQEGAAVEHPTHLGMISATNALVEEVKAIADGTLKPSERRLSDPKNTAHIHGHFRSASEDAAHRLSGGKVKLEFYGEPYNVLPHAVASDSPKLVPVEPKPRPR